MLRVRHEHSDRRHRQEGLPRHVRPDQHQIVSLDNWLSFLRQNCLILHYVVSSEKACGPDCLYARFSVKLNCAHAISLINTNSYKVLISATTSLMCKGLSGPH